VKNNHVYQEKNFEEINIGDEVEFEEYFDLERHVAFRNLFKDFSPVHNDSKFSKNTNYKDVIGYGFMLNGFLSRLYGEYLPGGSSICIKQESNFRKAFYIGDKIKVVGKVIDKIYSTKFVVIETKMYRNNKECIFNGKGVVQVVFDKNNCVPLYKAENNDCIYYNDFVECLKQLGIKKDDVLFIHSDISKFGKLASKDRRFILGTLVNVFNDIIGNDGTLLMPTFSYSFCNNEIYDVQNTSGKVGILNEYFRKLPDTVRTLHPIFSVAISGNKKHRFLDVSKDSFGENCIFDKIRKFNGKLVFFGANFQSCTYLHYIEQMHGIPYRYMKTFKGKIKNKNNIYDNECTYFVRHLDRNVILDTTRLEKYLLDNGFMKKAIVGYGEVLVIDAKTLYEEGFRLLDKDIYYFLKEGV
jgi:aminoglycoside 3-N-acetyltransferase